MMLETFGDVVEAAKIRQAVSAVLEEGWRTKDIWSNGMLLASTDEMGDKIASHIKDD